MDAVAENKEYDKQIIEKGNVFVEEADPEARYLTKRRYKTKAKSDVYFFNQEQHWNSFKSGGQF